MRKIFTIILLAFSISVGQEGADEKKAENHFIFEPDSLFH
tara:strand:+ start:581 stop:700 length:120 start_codon:yes stop_codon:yes gene_type:complete